MTVRGKERRSVRRMMRNGVTACAFIGGEEVECLVSDLNGNGAHLVFHRTIKLPKVISISFNPRAKPRLAHVRWQRGGRAGIEFAASS